MSMSSTLPFFDSARKFELSLSENPFAPLPSVLSALNQVMAHANRYPEFLPNRLPQVIADRIGIDADQVVVGSGATGVAMQIMQTLIGDGEQIVFATPNFDGYPIMASILGVRTATAPLDSSGRQNLAMLRALIDDRTRVVVVCRPHNPTGTLVSAAEFTGFMADVPPDVVVILDEAYVEFVSGANQLDVLDLVRRYSNLLVLRTFSKAFGLAGLRIGYAFGAHGLVEQVRRLQLPFGINSAAVAAVRASYAAEHELHTRIGRITAEREHLRNMLVRKGYRVPRSYANFLFVPGADIAHKLERAGIVAKTYADGSARVAVGDPAASAAVLTALR